MKSKKMFRLLSKKILIPSFLDLIFAKYESWSLRSYGLLKKIRLRRCGKNFLVKYPLRILGGANIEIGNNFSSMGYTYLYGNEGNIIIGNNCCLNTNVQIGASGGSIRIGNNVLLGPNVVLRAANHGINKNKLIKNQFHIGGEIIIEDDVWVAANAVVLKGVRLGTGCVVAAGAVVTKSFEPLSIVAGIPAKKISERIDET